jgi:hypothetical protein
VAGAEADRRETRVYVNETVVVIGYVELSGIFVGVVVAVSD